MEITRTFEMFTDRYQFDVRCTPNEGWAQVDTRNDASYHGTWANPLTLQIVSFCEGDVTRYDCSDEPEAFDRELRGMQKVWRSAGTWKGIDTMMQSKIECAFRRLGMADLFYDHEHGEDPRTEAEIAAHTDQLTIKAVENFGRGLAEAFRFPNYTRERETQSEP